MSKVDELFGAVTVGLLDEVKRRVNPSWFGLKKGLSVNLKNPAGFSLLHMAANDGHAEIASFLIEKGAKIDARAESGFTPLHCAAQMDSTEVINVLISKGADVNAKDIDEMTPISAAIPDNYVDAVKALIAAGAELDGVFTMSGRAFTPLGMADFFELESMIELLKEAGATNSRHPPRA